jgi:hypothetical protein
MAIKVLSCAVLLRHLHGSEENESAEDSDYEDEPEPTDGSVSGDAEVGREEERGQRLLPIFGIGSPVA